MANSAIQGATLIDFPAGMVMPFAGATVPAGWLECDGSEIDIAQYPILAAALGATWNTAKNPLTGANHPTPAAGKFRVPDMRGAFLRGSSNGANNAQGVSTALAEFQSQKTRKNGLDATAASSSVSGTTSLNHSHSASGVSGTTNISHTHSASATRSTRDGSNPFRHNNGGSLAGFVIPNFGSNDGTNQLNADGQSLGTNNKSLSSGSATGQSLTGTNNSALSSGSATAQVITVGDGDAETRPDAVGVRYLIKY